MSKDDLYYLRHMLEYARKIQVQPGSQDRTLYDAQETIKAALTYWLQVIGEAARHVSDPYQQAHPEVPWRAMIAMRNRIVHDYLGIDDAVVWETVSRRIAELILLLEELLPPE
jgi:uncharacterized protein with HEPN domain